MADVFKQVDGMVLVDECIEVQIITKNMRWILDTIYSGQRDKDISRTKILMIKALRMMNKMSNPNKVWGLHLCKQYIESNWDF